jgi:hypothetical protein
MLAAQPELRDDKKVAGERAWKEKAGDKVRDRVAALRTNHRVDVAPRAERGLADTVLLVSTHSWISAGGNTAAQ